MIEVDCRKCKNLGNDGCKSYGKDVDVAVDKCAKDCFKNYKKSNLGESLNVRKSKEML